MASPGPIPPRGSGFYAGQLVNGQVIQTLQQFAGQGLSQNQALAGLRAAGLQISNAAGRAVFNEAAGTVGSGQAINQTPYAFRPTAGTFRPVTYNLGADFLVRASVTVPTLIPDQPHVINAVVKYNGLKTRSELIALILPIITPRLGSLGLVDDQGNPLIDSGDVIFTQALRQA